MGDAKPGLKKLRRVSGKKPTYSCSNCKCMRYTNCNCMTKKEK